MRPLMPPVQTPDNLFHDGNPLTGELGTIVDAEHLNNVQGAVRDAQSELITVLTAAGINVDPTKQNQLLTALKALLLSRSNPFGDIKSDGAAAIATALTNLGLRTAAKRDVGNSTNQVPDMSFFTLGLSGAFRLPTGHIIQTGGGTAVGGGFTQAYPYPFPGSCQALVGIVYGTLGQRAFVTSNSSDRTAANLNVVDINGNGLNASIGYIAIGY